MKKLISGLMSACVAVSSAIALTTSSAFNPNKDPNGDGHLTIADSTAILQYLGGYYEPDDLTELDMDDNDVVSVVDSNYVKMYDAGLINTSIEGAVEPMAENSASEWRTYVAYDSQSGNRLRTYSLRVIGSADTSNTRTVIGTDERVQDWSNIGVAKIISADDSYHLGTGFVVDNHTIATAAHVVYDTETSYAYSLIELLLFDENGEEHSFTPVEYHIPMNYINLTDYQANYDYALITVEEDLSDYMSFDLGAITDNAINNTFQITTIGFPSYANGYTNHLEVHNKMMSNGEITTNCIDDKEYIFSHSADTSGGNSGGPIYTTETLNGVTYYTVIGIHSGWLGNYNTGVRFTSHVLKFLSANTNINY